MKRILFLCFFFLSTCSFAFTLSSSAFSDQGKIPTQYTCQGANISPPLQWSEPPVNTQGYALIMQDPDAPQGTWTHWVLYNIPFGVTSLEANLPAEVMGLLVGSNSWQNVHYQGPCPPKGASHHYVFTLYALDQPLFSPPGYTATELTQTMQNHILGQAQLTGIYQ